MERPVLQIIDSRTVSSGLANDSGRFAVVFVGESERGLAINGTVGGVNRISSIEDVRAIGQTASGNTYEHLEALLELSAQEFYYARVLGSGAALAKVDLLDGAGDDAVSVSARGEGAFANAYSVKVEAVIGSTTKQKVTVLKNSVEVEPAQIYSKNTNEMVAEFNDRGYEVFMTRLGSGDLALGTFALTGGLDATAPATSAQKLAAVEALNQERFKGALLVTASFTAAEVLDAEALLHEPRQMIAFAAPENITKTGAESITALLAGRYRIIAPVVGWGNYKELGKSVSGVVQLAANHMRRFAQGRFGDTGLRDVSRTWKMFPERKKRGFYGDGVVNEAFLQLVPTRTVVIGDVLNMASADYEIKQWASQRVVDMIVVTVADWLRDNVAFNDDYRIAGEDDGPSLLSRVRPSVENLIEPYYPWLAGGRNGANGKGWRLGIPNGGIRLENGHYVVTFQLGIRVAGIIRYIDLLIKPMAVTLISEAFRELGDGDGSKATKSNNAELPKKGGINNNGGNN